jgi:cellulose synthase/poly-beta-1,6-N-acetylglucosamine synthase-like glycosyltransferase
MIPQEFFDRLDSQLIHGVSVAQCSILPTGFEGSPIMTIIALSEMVEQIVFNSIRSFLGFSVRLRGTGMIFDPALLVNIGPNIGTEVEDVALSLLVAEQKIAVRWFKSVVVFDPKPGECTDATRQRARWFRGQWRAFWDYRSIVLKLFARGPNGWSILSSLFLKPRWLKLTLMIILGFALLMHPVAAVIVFSIVSLEIILILLGTLLLPKRGLFIRSLMYIPGFIIMWLKGIILSLKRHQWLRVRKNLNFQEDRDPETVIFK